MSHVIAIHQVYFSFFAATDNQMRMIRAPDRIRQQERTTRAKVGVRRGQAGLVIRGKVIGDRETAGRDRQFYKTVTIFRSIGVRVEWAIADFKIEIRAAVSAWTVASHP